MDDKEIRQPSAFSALHAAINEVNDNILALADNLAETHAVIVRLERLLTDAPLPPTKGRVKRNEEPKDNQL